MNKILDNIETFINLKEKCPFCQNKLKPSLTNFVMAADTIPLIKCRLQGEEFYFNIKHTSHSFQITAQATVNIKTNILQLQLTTPVVMEQYATDYIMAKSVFENMKPYVELYCSSRRCKMKYHMCSDIFICLKREDSYSSFYIKPFSAYMESFVTGDYWVQNDWINNSANIYNRNKTDSDPIRTHILNIESMGKEKVINRIKTLVTFS
jgi:hypothetical protein